MREAATRGFWISSRAPYGYRRVYVQDGVKKRPRLEPDPPADGVVRRIFQLADSGKALLDITKTLNAEGIASPKGKSWRKTTIYKLLTNEVYTGMMVWGTQSKDKTPPVRVEDAFPALVSRPVFYAGGDGGSAREGYRQLLTATLEPYASLITAEFREKIGYPATPNFRRLAAADIAARARAFGTLKASGVSDEDAAQVSGLDLYAEKIGYSRESSSVSW